MCQQRRKKCSGHSTAQLAGCTNQPRRVCNALLIRHREHEMGYDTQAIMDVALVLASVAAVALAVVSLFVWGGLV